MIPAMLGARRDSVFSKRAVLRTRVGPDDASRDQRRIGCRRKRCSILGGRLPEHARKAGGERANALEADGEADVGHGAVACPQEGRGSLQPTSQEVRVRRLAECAPELTAEMGAGQPGGAGKVVDVQRLEVASVGEILRAQEVPAGWN